MLHVCLRFGEEEPLSDAVGLSDQLRVSERLFEPDSSQCATTLANTASPKVSSSDLNMHVQKAFHSIRSQSIGLALSCFVSIDADAFWCSLLLFLSSLLQPKAKNKSN